ncbi:MAG: ABC transporter ATP-binding protein [Bacteroidota bacterium]
MKIELSKLSKRYRYEWIFNNLNYTFESGKCYAITGANGSGKSTLMRILSAYLSPTKGKIIHAYQDKILKPENIYQQLAYAAPYMDLIEELSLKEQLLFHQKFKPFLLELSIENLLELLAFRKAKNKQISHFSSGMKQRLKLLLAICSDVPLLLLDEPTTNLDRQGVDWYLQLIEQFAKERTIIVASNVEEDYGFCDAVLNIMDYKPQAR